MPTFVEDKENTDTEVSSHLSHVESSSQSSGHHETEPGIPLPDVQEQFSDTNLRYKCVGLCAFKEKECELLFADYVKASELSSHNINWIVL